MWGATETTPQSKSSLRCSLSFKDLILYSARFNDIKGQEKLRKARLPIHALSLRLNKQAKHDET